MVEDLQQGVKATGQRHADSVDVRVAWSTHLARTGSTRRRHSSLRIALVAAAVVAVVAGVGIGASFVLAKPASTAVASAPECPVHYDVHAASGVSTDRLAPSGQPAGVELCAYSSALGPNSRLTSSTAVDQQLSIDIVDELNDGQQMGRARPGIYCPRDTGLAYQMIFTYLDRSTATVMFEATGCRYAYTDQLYTIGTDRLAGLVSRAVGASVSSSATTLPNTGADTSAGPGTAAAPLSSGPSLANPGQGAVIKGRLQMAGGPAPGTPRAIAGDITVHRGSTIAGEVVTTEKVGATGQFAIDAAAGTYTLTGTSPMIQGGLGLCRGETPIVVAPGQTMTNINVTCSIK